MRIQNPERIVAVALFLTLAAAFFSERKQGHGIPRPRAVAAYMVGFSLLGLVAGLGGQAGRIAGAIAGLIAFAAVVTGTLGKSIVDVLNRSTSWLGGARKAAVVPAAQNPQAGAATAHGGGGGFLTAPRARP